MTDTVSSGTLNSTIPYHTPKFLGVPLSVPIQFDQVPYSVRQRVGERPVSIGSDTTHTKGVGPQYPLQDFQTFYINPHSMTKQIKFCIMIKIDRLSGEIFTWSTTRSALAEISLDRNADSRSVCDGVNLLVHGDDTNVCTVFSKPVKSGPQASTPPWQSATMPRTRYWPRNRGANARLAPPPSGTFPGLVFIFEVQVQNRINRFHKT